MQGGGQREDGHQHKPEGGQAALALVPGADPDAQRLRARGGIRLRRDHHLRTRGHLENDSHQR